MSRVLVVDDEPGIVGFVSRALTIEGLDVDSAGDGANAMRMARNGSYQLIVLDLMLPDVNGIAVLREILQYRPEQRVLVLSAIGEVEAKISCLEYGAADYVAKPFVLPELVARVKARLREANAAPPPRCQSIGGIELDLRRHAVRIDGQVAALSQREFFLLRHLMSRADDVCTREDLLSKVWGLPFDPGSNVVDVYVRRLRRKLGKQSERIKTIRNVGYLFEAS